MMHFSRDICSSSTGWAETVPMFMRSTSLRNPQKGGPSQGILYLAEDRKRRTKESVRMIGLVTQCIVGPDQQ